MRTPRGLAAPQARDREDPKEARCAAGRQPRGPRGGSLRSRPMTVRTPRRLAALQARDCEDT